jgi:hypothetical protein
MSDTAPAGSVNRKYGIEARVDISDKKRGDVVRMFIVQVAAVSYAATQVPEIKLATQNRLNAGFPSAAQVDVLIMSFNEIA